MTRDEATLKLIENLDGAMIAIGHAESVINKVYKDFEPKTQYELEILIADLIYKFQMKSGFRVDEIKIKKEEIINNGFKVNAYLDNMSLIKPIIEIKSTDIKKGKV